MCAKKDNYYLTAEKLYVHEFMTLNEITTKLPVAERTLRYWKDEGDWDRKRLEYQMSKKAVHQEMYEMIKTLGTSIRSDLAAGNQVDAGRLYSFVKLTQTLDKMKKYEDAITGLPVQTDDTDLTVKILKEFGIEQPESH